MESLLYLVVFVCTLLLVEGKDTSNCPASIPRNQFLDVNNELCYEFKINHETYWDDAQNDCAHRGGNLVTVKDKATQDYLMEMLQSFNFDHHGIWIGFNDRAKEDDYVWASGVPTGYMNWADGEPSLFRGVEDCVLMKSTKSFQWEDHPCHLWPQHYTYICEYKLIPRSTTPAPTSTLPTTTPSTPTTPTTPTTLPTTTQAATTVTQTMTTTQTTTTAPAATQATTAQLNP